MAVLEQVYGVLPSWAQNIAISLYGLSWRAERLGGNFPTYVSQFRERETWPPERFHAYVESTLRNKLLKAYEEVPYYRERWREAGIRKADLAAIRTSELSRLPITPKQDLRHQPSRFVAESAHRGKGKIHSYFSSGSTGTPIRCFCTADDHRRFVAAREARSFQWAGTTLLGSRSMIGGRMVVPKADAGPPYYRHNMVEKQTYFSAFHISPAAAENYVAGFNRYRPEVLTGYAQSYFLLGRMMLDAGLRLTYRPKALILSSEKLTLIARETIQEAFGARPYEEYGAVENCMLATECPEGSLHCHPDFGIVEIVGEEGQPLPPGVDGRVVCTGFPNETQYTVRYEIGDLARWSSKGCACGRDHLPVLEEVVGRVEDVVVGPDGRQMVRFHGIFIDLPHVVAGQVVQESRQLLRIRVIAGPGFGENEERLIRKRVYERLGSLEVLVEQVSELERTRQGKIRAVISRLPPGAVVQKPQVAAHG